MPSVRSVIAIDPRKFGRRASSEAGAVPVTQTIMGDDARLFATTFVAGFLFVSVLIA